MVKWQTNQHFWSTPASTCGYSTIFTLPSANNRQIQDQRITLKVRSHWLLKLGISFAIHIRATRAGFAPENIVIVIVTESCSVLQVE